MTGVVDILLYGACIGTGKSADLSICIHSRDIGRSEWKRASLL